MNTTMKAIAKAASVATFGLFALAPAVASAAPAAESVGIVQMGAGSTGGGDSHGHNSNNLPQPQGPANPAPVHVLTPGGQR